MKKIIKKILLVLLRIYFRLRFLPPIWYLINGKTALKFWLSRPRLNPEQQRLVNELKTTGIALSHVSNFPELGALYSKSLEYIRKARAKDLKPGKNKPFLVSLLSAADEDQPIFDLGAHGTLKAVADAYIGVDSQLDILSLNLTLPVGPSADPVKSQRWHRDPEDRRQCKIFIYLTDVDGDAGPFFYAQQSLSKYKNFFPRELPRGFYPEIGAVEKVISDKDILKCCGTKGTLVFADTTGLHRGGYATRNERIMITAGYFSRASNFPRKVKGLKGNKKYLFNLYQRWIGYGEKDE